MKKLPFYLLVLMITQKSIGQQNYCDFDGTKVINFGAATGEIDSLFINPAASIVNNSAYCAQYIRSDTTLYDNFKIYPYAKLGDITTYVSNNVATPKIKMKLYTTAPVGTLINLQLGLKSNDNYPAGVHSEYAATTSVQNTWENISFNYMLSPAGSAVLSTEIDKIVILFNPNSSVRDTFYFDNLMGPELSPAGIPVVDFSPFKLYQNTPNPVKENTNIKFQLNFSGSVSLKLYDLLGNLIYSPLEDQSMKTGAYSIPIETTDIPNGVYFYILKKDGISKSMKMVISK